MGERIGLISRNLADVANESLQPDLFSAHRSLEVLDKQVRFLEESGISNSLGLAIEVIPGSSLYYTDVAGMRDGPRPGFVLRGGEFERRSPRKKVTHRTDWIRGNIVDVVQEEGTEAVHAEIIVTPDIKSGLLELSTFVHFSHFVFDDGTSINTTGNEYSRPLFLDPKNRDQMKKTLFTVIEKVGIVPSVDNPKVMYALSKRLSVR